MTTAKKAPRATKAAKAPAVDAKITSKQIIELLRIHRHPPGREWATFAEVRNETGYSIKGGIRSMDLFAVNCWPSKGFRSVAYEVKVDRADFMRELIDPAKREHAEAVAMECWFATPPGLVSPDEVPQGWGLVVVSANGSPKTLKMPLQRSPAPWDMPFIASLLRKAADAPSEVPLALWRMAGKELTTDDLKTAFIEETGAIRQSIREEVAEEMQQAFEARIKRAEDEVVEARRLKEALGERLGIRGRHAAYMPVDQLIRCIDAPEWDPGVVREMAGLRDHLTRMVAKASEVPPIRRNFPKGESVPLELLEDKGGGDGS